MTSQPRTFALIPASYVYLRRDDQVLLQQRINTGYMDGHWAAGAAGHIEPGETAQTAAVREVAEELGVIVRESDLRLLTVMQRTDGTDTPREQRVDWFWAATTWAGNPEILEPTKNAQLAWCDLDQLPPLMPLYEQLMLACWWDQTLPLTCSFGFDSDPATLR